MVCLCESAFNAKCDKAHLLVLFTEQEIINLHVLAFLGGCISELSVLLPPSFFACASLELIILQVTEFVARILITHIISCTLVMLKQGQRRWCNK